MSRIGKKPVAVPAGVKVSIGGQTVKMEGPKGSLSFTHDARVKVTWAESEKALMCAIDGSLLEDKQARALWGTTRAILSNMVRGVTQGYTKTMEIVGVGWQAALAGKDLKLSVGFASPVVLSIPSGVTVTVDKAIVTITGADKQAVGEFAAKMRSKRKPEPYNGKGIKYQTETIKRKQGKQFGA